MVVPNTATMVSIAALAEVASAQTMPSSACGPIDVHQQDHPDIGEQAEGQPFEDVRIVAVGDEQLQHDAQHGEGDHEHVLAAADDQLRRPRPSPTGRRRC